MITKMNESTNHNNNESLLNLLPHFYLSSRSENRCVEAILEPEWPWFWNLEHNGQNRIMIPIESGVEHDNAFALYKDLLELVALHRGKLSYTRFLELAKYPVWKQGKTPEGEKLFKYLLKKDILDTTQIQRLTTMRNGESDLFLVISRNPMDYLFMSTNQSFHSCVSLNSEHDGAYYMGLPFYFVNSQTVLLFITTGKLKTYQIKDQEFKHFGYVGRSVCTWNSDLSFMAHRWYPFMPELPILPALRSLGLQISKPSYEWTTKGSFDDLRFSNDETCRAYLDVPYTTWPGRFHYYGGGGSPMNNSWEDGFENLRSLDALMHSKTCSCCNNVMNSSDDDMDDNICSSCANDHFRCDNCDDRYHNDESYYVESQDTHICGYCRSNYYERCEECDELHHNNRVRTVANGDWVCTYCLDEHYVECGVCGELYHGEHHNMIDHDDSPNGWYCPGCWKDYLTDQPLLSPMEEIS